jgi:hypothetical protein
MCSINPDNGAAHGNSASPALQPTITGVLGIFDA